MMSIAGRQVLIVEDLLDTGLTPGVLLERLWARQPASLKFCVLLRKQIRCVSDLTPDDLGFDVPDGFVVGYGTDYAKGYRQLPAIYTLSMATMGKVTANGYAERLMRTIKEEEVTLHDYADFHEAYQSNGRFLDNVYQHMRSHLAMGYPTLAEFETR